VPARHLLRSIDRFVELDGLRRQLAPFYSAIGRPSIDPELMIRMLIVGYCLGIRSERRLREEVSLQKKSINLTSAVASRRAGNLRASLQP
jgi:transposase